MTLIIFRHLPAVAAIEEQLRLQSLALLSDDEAEELPHLVDDASRELFGITANDTLYPTLPEPLRANYGRAEWEANFAILCEHPRDTHEHWRASGLDLCCEEGRTLHCLSVFGRQLICALNGLHPQARLAFADGELAKAA
jgi:hypothetical protein